MSHWQNGSEDVFDVFKNGFKGLKKMNIPKYPILKKKNGPKVLRAQYLTTRLKKPIVQ